jgi:hypothetical protein
VVRGAWCVVRGAWCVVRGAWCVVRGAWCVVRGAWCVVRGAIACCDMLRSVTSYQVGVSGFKARSSNYSCETNKNQCLQNLQFQRTGAFHFFFM